MRSSINKEKAIQSLQNYCKEMECVDECAVETVKCCINIIKSIGSYDVAPVAHGEWVEKPYLLGSSNFCSVCGDNFGMPHGKYKYCPTCGAKMDLNIKEDR